MGTGDATPGQALWALQEILQNSAMFAKEKKKEKKSESLSGVVRLSVSDSVRPWQSFCDRVTIVPRRPGTESKTRWKPIDPPFEPQERRLLLRSVLLVLSLAIAFAVAAVFPVWALVVLSSSLMMASNHATASVVSNK
jgi:hypothetical protein